MPLLGAGKRACVLRHAEACSVAYMVAVMKKSPTSTAFQELRQAKALCQGKHGMVSLGVRMFEAVLTEMREEVHPECKTWLPPTA